MDATHTASNGCDHGGSENASCLGCSQMRELQKTTHASPAHHHTTRGHNWIIPTHGHGPHPTTWVKLNEMTLKSWILSILCVVTVLASGCDAQDQVHLQYSLHEEVGTGTFLADIFRDSGISARHNGNATILSQLRYGFLKQDQSIFAIDEGSGEIRTRARLDREVMCPFEESCQIRIDVAVRPIQYFHIIKLTVTIEDINDNIPEFPEVHIQHAILESAEPDSSFVIPTAVDKDSPKFSVQRYELLPREITKFGLRLSNSVDGSTEVKVTLREKLDREDQGEYNLRVVAYDGGTPVKMGAVDVRITVLDANDNHPSFDHPTYEVIIHENVARHTTIATVKATDPDDGPNGEIRYSLSPRSQASYGGMFGINNKTGDLYTNGVIDYEENTIYHLSITARDMGADSIPGDATVVVKVLDVNDHYPRISLNTLSDSNTGSAEVPENAAPDTFVAHITVTDSDSGANSQVNCSLSDKHFRLKYLYDAEFQILTRATFDREVKNKYTLTLSCRDGGSPPKITAESIDVFVLDENDHDPMFSQRVYTSNLIENNFEGAELVRVFATDDDLGENAMVTYSIEDSRRHLFSVDANSGTVKVNIKMDHEEVEQMEFYVIATDHGVPARSASAKVIINVEDLNDERPRFSSSSYSFSLFENQQPGQEVGFVSAGDNDGPPFNHFTYSFLQSHSHSDSFEIDSRTGRISNSHSLDRELQSVYFLVVVAHDSGTPPLSSTTSVSIYVADKNDNPPVFIFPNDVNSTISVSNQVREGNIVTRIDARDPDMGNNAKLTYKLGPGNEKRYFDIDPVRGIILVNKDLSSINNQVFELTLIAEDNGLPQLATHATLNIIVNKSIAFLPGRDNPYGPVLNGNNLVIVIVVAAISAIITTALVVAIILIRRQDRMRNANNYNCRTEAMKFFRRRPRKQLPSDCQSSTSSGSAASSGDENKCCVTKSSGKKEVSFSLDVADTGYKTNSHMTMTISPDDRPVSRQSWPSTIDQNMLQNPQACSSMLTSTATAGISPPNGKDPNYYQHHHDNAQGYNPHQQQQWQRNSKDIEVQHLLELLRRGEADADSLQSGDEGSNTDSGRGPSEEGEGGRGTDAHATLNTAITGTPHAAGHNSSCSPIAEESYVSTASNQVVPCLPNISMHSPNPSLSTTYLGSYRPPSRTRQVACSKVPSFGSLAEDTSETQSTFNTDSTFLNQTGNSELYAMTSETGSPKSARSPKPPPLYPRKQCPSTGTHGSPGGCGPAINSRSDSYSHQPAPPLPPRPTYSSTVGAYNNHHSGHHGNSDGEGDSMYSEAPTMQYTCVDMSDILASKAKTPAAARSVDDDDDTTTSGSYVVDPQELCEEIDDVFFRDMKV